MSRFTVTVLGLSLLLCGGASLAAPAERDSQLYEAVLYGETAKVDELLAQGADPNHKEGGRSLIIWAAQGRWVEVVEALLAAGADIDSLDGVGQTALRRAIAIVDIPMVKTLLAAGADPDVKVPNGGAALPDAGSNSRILNLLLDAGADPNVTNEHEETALYTVIEYGSIEDLQALIDAGADVNHKDRNGLTPVYRAEFFQKLEMKELLERNGGTESGEG